MPRVKSGWRSAALVGLLAAAVAWLGVLQVRSQAEVARSLEGQDNTALAFTIDDLHRANDQLGVEAADLSTRRDALRRGGDVAASADLEAEARKLRIVAGLVPVTGPGVVVEVDAPLSPLDLQDAVNNLRVSGAEAITVNGRRIVNGSVIRAHDGEIEVDGAVVRRPWTLQAIGDPGRLPAGAQAMTQSLRADRRVVTAGYTTDNELEIRSVVRPRPYVYGAS